MKKIVLSFSLALLFLSPMQALAQTKTSDTPSTTTTRSVKTGQEARPAAAKGTTREPLTDNRKGNIAEHVRIMLLRVSGATDALEALIARIQTRINRIEELNPAANIADAQEMLDEAKAKLEEAKDSLASLEANLENLLNSENPREAFANVRVDLDNLKGMLNDIKQLLKDTLQELRGLQQNVQKPTR